MKKEITYSGNGQVCVEMPDGTMFKFTKGITAKHGEIPNDAFDGLSKRPDFGASLEEYRLSRRGLGLPKPEPTPKKASTEKRPAMASKE